MAALRRADLSTARLCRSAALGLAILGLTFVGGCKSSPSGPRCVEMDRIVAEAATRSETLRAALVAAIPAMESAAAAADAPPCPVAAFRHGSSSLWEGDDVTRLRPPTLDILHHVPGTIALYRDTCDGGDEISQTRTIAESNAALTDAASAHDLIVRVRSRTNPRLLDNQTFEGGELVWDAWVWSYATGQFVCHGTGTSENRSRVHSGNPMRSTDALQLDLENQAVNDARQAPLRALTTAP